MNNETMTGLISESEIEIYAEQPNLSEAEKWRYVANKWRKAALNAQANADFYSCQLSSRGEP
jgi:hypothetical protein